LGAREGADVAHFDGTQCELREKLVLVCGEVIHDGHTQCARSVVEGLVADEDALACLYVAVVAVIEGIRGCEVQILQACAICIARLCDAGIGVRVDVDIV
jgi:hypothetical protein